MKIAHREAAQPLGVGTIFDGLLVVVRPAGFVDLTSVSIGLLKLRTIRGMTYSAAMTSNAMNMKRRTKIIKISTMWLMSTLLEDDAIRWSD